MSALAVTLALTPLLLDRVPAAALGGDPVLTLKVIAVESLVGGMIGLLARIFYLRPRGPGGRRGHDARICHPFGVQIEAGETMPPLGDAHLSRRARAPVRGRSSLGAAPGPRRSYDVIPVGADFNARLALKQIADALGESFRLALRIASPYVIYALVVNLALALVNRLTPQIQVFFVAAPFVAAGGLAASLSSPSNRRSKRFSSASPHGFRTSGTLTGATMKKRCRRVDRMVKCRRRFAISAIPGLGARA